MRRKRVLIAGLYHETHTFLDGTTSLEDCEILRGAALLELHGDSSPMAGALAAGRDLDWDVVPVIYLRAAPGPIVRRDVVELFWSELEAGLTRLEGQPLDGVLLILHGAMVSEEQDDVEGELLQRLRRCDATRLVPICGVLDLHANFTARMARCADGLIAYGENPHVDAAPSAVRAVHLLDRILRGAPRPATVMEQIPLLLPPTRTGTADEPMKSWERMAREIEATHPEIRAVNVLAGFAFADVRDAGVCFSAVTEGDPRAAGEQLQRLARRAMEMKDAFHVSEISPEEAMRRIGNHTGGPVILAEPSDNIGAGAPGDCTGLLRALARHDVQNAVIVINDPQAVQALRDIPVGATARIGIGGKGWRLDAGPAQLDVQLVSRSDGRFTLEDSRSHLASMLGNRIDMGPCAVVRHRGITILLTSRRTPPFDLGQLRSQGIEPQRAAVIVVKAAVAHRQAYDPIARACYWVDVPGPCGSDLKQLPYRKVRRPIHPLDDLAAPGTIGTK